MRTNTAAIRVGRLLEVRAEAGYRTVADVDAVFDVLEREVAKLGPVQRHVTVVDWRGCPVMSPEAVERLAQRIALTNARTERSALLAGAGAPVAVLQFLRVIRDARLPERKLFFKRQELVDWLAEVLTKEEAERLLAFLAERTYAEPEAEADFRTARLRLNSRS
jgi:hypothetical protein